MALLTDVDDKNLQTLSRHPVYYIPTGDLSFLVEHVQFRVHKYFFDRESSFFGSQLSAPHTPGTPVRGSGDANAIVLETVTVEEFAKFLWVFYNPKYSIYDAPTEDWEIILILAHRWGFPEVKNLAVRELEKKTMLDVKRIKLYHDTHVNRHFLIPRYAALCEREEPLSLAEGMDLGMETTLMIARGREEARASRSTSGVRSPLTPTIHGADLHEFIRELFQIGADADTTTTTTAGGEGSYTTGALAPKPRTEPPRTAGAQATPLTPTQTQTTAAAAPRTMKETPPPPPPKGAQGTPAKGTTKKAGRTGQQQTKGTTKPETETITSPAHLGETDKDKDKDKEAAKQTKEVEKAKVEVTTTTTDKAGTDSTTPLDLTTLHVNTDATPTTTTTAPTTAPATTTTTTATTTTNGTTDTTTTKPPAFSLYDFSSFENKGSSTSTAGASVFGFDLNGIL